MIIRAESHNGRATAQRVCVSIHQERVCGEGARVRFSRRLLSILAATIICLGGCSTGMTATSAEVSEQLTPDASLTRGMPPTPLSLSTTAPEATKGATVTTTPLAVARQTATPAPEPTRAATPYPLTEIEFIPGSVVLYAQDGGLKSCPHKSLFDRPEMQSLYDPVVGGEAGLSVYLVSHAPVPSPDGRWLVVNDPSPPGGPDTQPGTTWLGDLETGELSKLAAPAVFATWSPDSQYLTYVRGETLYTLDVVGNGEPVGIFSQEGLIGLYARWSPTGEWIAVASVVNPQDSSDRMYRYWLVSPDGTSVQDIGTFQTRGFGASPQDLDWSPDGALLDTPSQVLLTLDGQSMDYSEIKQDPPASVPARFTSWLIGGGTKPKGGLAVLSHNGQKIAYLGQDGIHVFDRELRTSMLIATYDMGEAEEPYWSTDDDLLVVSIRSAPRSAQSTFWGAILALRAETGSMPRLLIDGDDVYLVDVIPENAL